MTDDGLSSIDHAVELYRAGQLGESRAALEDLLAKQPEHADGWAALGYLQRDIGDAAAAAAAFDAALRISAGDPRALAGRARIALERAEPNVLGRYADALAASPGDRRLLLEQTEASVERGDASAIADFARVADRNPDWTDGQLALARMRWESFGDERFDAGIRRRLAQEPRRLDLWIGLIDLLSTLDRFDSAAAVAENARRALGDKAELLLREAMNAGRAGDVARAGRLFARLPVNDPAVLMEHALHFVRAGALDHARDTIDAALAQIPGSISAWGAAELIYRAFGDPRSEWLSGLDGLVRTIELGLDTALIGRITQLLLALHATGVQATGQSVRDGTQTRWRLFDRPESELAELKQAIEAAIGDYLAGLPPADDRHPLLRHRDAALKITGSWSVRLTGSGRHVSHIHPLGLIGSASYFIVPGEQSGGKLELGRPPPDLKLDLEPLHVISPRPGLLALFPSYLHHGTTPFTSRERLSVAFDVALDPAA